MKNSMIRSVAAAWTPVWAADIPTKAPAPTPPAIAATNWTGCYIGAHVGGGWGGRELSAPVGFPVAGPLPLFGSTSLSIDQWATGALGGGHAGCNYQFANNWVVGIKGDFSAADLVGNRTLALDAGGVIPAELHIKTDWVVSATAIFGYSFNRLLVYGKGGAAWAHNFYQVALAVPDFAPADFTAKETRSGWTVGAGLEYSITKNLSSTFEYNYYDFGTRVVQFVDQFAPASTGSLESKQRIHAIKFGLNYYLWNAPAVPGVAPPAPPPMSWSETFNSEVRYFSWHSNRGVPTNALATGEFTRPVAGPGSGTEVYVPYAAQVTGQSDNLKIEMLARGGWVRARQSTGGLTGEISTATDSQMNGTVTYLGFKGVQPFASIDFNLPTGRSALTPTQVFARMDPDLVDIASFGEGFNFGPTVGFNVPITNSLIVTASVGYTDRGQFDAEAPLTPPTHASVAGTRINPGNDTTGTVSVGYATDAWNGKLIGTISQGTATTVNGAQFIRPGRRYLVSGSFGYNWPQPHIGTTTVNASASHSNRNDVTFQCLLPGCPTDIVTEPLNTNSNLFRVSVDHRFRWDNFTLGPTGSYLHRDENGYVPTTLQFVPAKDRWSAGLLAQYAPNNIVSFNARLERVWTHENTAPSLTPNTMFSILANSPVTAFTVPVVSSTGWQFVFGLTASL